MKMEEEIMKPKFFIKLITSCGCESVKFISEKIDYSPPKYIDLEKKSNPLPMGGYETDIGYRRFNFSKIERNIYRDTLREVVFIYHENKDLPLDVNGKDSPIKLLKTFNDI